MGAALFSSQIDNNNLETYSLIWLDSSVNSSQGKLDAQQKLRKLNNHLLTFENDQQCLQHLQLLSEDDRVILIVSGKLGRILVPQIVSLRQIISIYVYCIDKNANEQWSQQFFKFCLFSTLTKVYIHYYSTR